MSLEAGYLPQWQTWLRCNISLDACLKCWQTSSFAVTQRCAGPSHHIFKNTNQALNSIISGPWTCQAQVTADITLHQAQKTDGAFFNLC